MSIGMLLWAYRVKIWVTDIDEMARTVVREGMERHIERGSKIESKNLKESKDRRRVPSRWEGSGLRRGLPRGIGAGLT